MVGAGVRKGGGYLARGSADVEVLVGGRRFPETTRTRAVTLGFETKWDRFLVSDGPESCIEGQQFACPTRVGVDSP